MARTTALSNGPSDPRMWAAGLHLWGTQTTYLFDDFKVEDRLIPIIVLGRDKKKEDKPKVHIRVDDHAVSEVHAMIERIAGQKFLIRDSGSTNGTWINGEVLTSPRVLVVGMEVRVGRRARFVAVDRDGNVPLQIRSLGEYCQRLCEMYGNSSAAARRADVGREFIPRHAQAWRRQGRSAR